MTTPQKSALEVVREAFFATLETLKLAKKWHEEGRPNFPQTDAIIPFAEKAIAALPQLEAGVRNEAYDRAADFIKHYPHEVKSTVGKLAEKLCLGMEFIVRGWKSSESLPTEASVKPGMMKAAEEWEKLWYQECVHGSPVDSMQPIDLIRLIQKETGDARYATGYENGIRDAKFRNSELVKEISDLRQATTASAASAREKALEEARQAIQKTISEGFDPEDNYADWDNRGDIHDHGFNYGKTAACRIIEQLKPPAPGGKND